jgi:hypothetical protein
MDEDAARFLAESAKEIAVSPALESLKKGLAIREQLTMEKPGDTKRRRDLGLTQRRQDSGRRARILKSLGRKPSLDLACYAR